MKLNINELKETSDEQNVRNFKKDPKLSSLLQSISGVEIVLFYAWG